MAPAFGSAAEKIRTDGRRTSRGRGRPSFQMAAACVRAGVRSAPFYVSGMEFRRLRPYIGGGIETDWTGAPHVGGI